MEIKVVLNEKPSIVIDNTIVTFKEGVRAILGWKNWTRETMAVNIGVSKRTIDGWYNGRKPSNANLIVLYHILK